MDRQRNPEVNRVCDAYFLELGDDIFPRQTVTNCLQRIGSKLITYENASPLRNQALLSQIQVRYVEYIIITSDTAKLGISRREVIQTISDIGQAYYYVQSENHLYYIIWERRLTNMKSYGQVTKYQAAPTEKPHICVSQQYCCHTTIDTEWGDLQRTNSPRDIYTGFAHYFQLNLDETSFSCNEGELKVLGSKDKPRHEKIAVTQNFQ